MKSSILAASVLPHSSNAAKAVLHSPVSGTVSARTVVAATKPKAI